MTNHSRNYSRYGRIRAMARKEKGNFEAKVKKHGPMPKLHRYAKNGKIDKIKKLIKGRQNYNINLTDALYGRTALMWGCYSGSREVIEYLIDLDADLNVLDKEGKNCKYFQILSMNNDNIHIFEELDYAPNEALFDICNGYNPINIDFIKKYIFSHKNFDGQEFMNKVGDIDFTNYKYINIKPYDEIWTTQNSDWIKKNEDICIELTNDYECFWRDEDDSRNNYKPWIPIRAHITDKNVDFWPVIKFLHNNGYILTEDHVFKIMKKCHKTFGDLLDWSPVFRTIIDDNKKPITNEILCKYIDNNSIDDIADRMIDFLGDSLTNENINKIMKKSKYFLKYIYQMKVLDWTHIWDIIREDNIDRFRMLYNIEYISNDISNHSLGQPWDDLYHVSISWDEFFRRVSISSYTPDKLKIYNEMLELGYNINVVWKGSSGGGWGGTPKIEVTESPLRLICLYASENRHENRIKGFLEVIHKLVETGALPYNDSSINKYWDQIGHYSYTWRANRHIRYPQIIREQVMAVMLMSKYKHTGLDDIPWEIKEMIFNKLLGYWEPKKDYYDTCVDGKNKNNPPGNKLVKARWAKRRQLGNQTSIIKQGISFKDVLMKDIKED